MYAATPKGFLAGFACFLVEKWKVRWQHTHKQRCNKASRMFAYRFVDELNGSNDGGPVFVLQGHA